MPIGLGLGLYDSIGAPASGDWTPANIPSSELLGWYKPESLESYSEGENITQWNDSSGNNNHLVQTVSNYPVCNVDHIGDFNAAYLVGKHMNFTNTLTFTRSATASGDIGIFIAMQQNWDGLVGILWGDGQNEIFVSNQQHLRGLVENQTRYFTEVDDYLMNTDITFELYKDHGEWKSYVDGGSSVYTAGGYHPDERIFTKLLQLGDDGGWFHIWEFGIIHGAECFANYRPKIDSYLRSRYPTIYAS